MLVDVLGKNVVWAVWCEILNETEVRCNREVVKTKAINKYLFKWKVLLSMGILSM